MSGIKKHKVATSITAAILVLGIGGSAFILNTFTDSETKTHTKSIISPAQTQPQEIIVADVQGATEKTVEPSPSVTPTPSSKPEPSFELRSMRVEEIESKSFNEKCQDNVMYSYSWNRTGVDWQNKVYELIETNQYGVHTNSEGKMVCIYYGTIDDLKG